MLSSGLVKVSVNIQVYESSKMKDAPVIPLNNIPARDHKKKLFILLNYLQPVKKAVIIFLFATAHLIANAQSQSIKEVFRSLPADQVYGLTVGTRDSILDGKTYYPSDNDSNSVEAYNYGVSEFVKDYMYVSLSYESGQQGFGMIEIRRFRTTKGQSLVLLSQTGGAPRSYYQLHLSLFTYGSDNTLVPYKKKLFKTADENIFMKPGTPDSVKKMILNNSNLSFNFSTEKPTLGLHSDYLSNTPLSRKWLKGDCIEFTWSGDRFIISRIYFED